MAHTYGAFVLTALVTCLHLLTSVNGQCGISTAVNITNVEETVYVVQGREANVTLTINDVTANGILSFRSSSVANFDLENTDVSFNLSTLDSYPFNITVTVVGTFIAIEELELLFTPAGSQDVLQVGSQTIGVRRVPNILQRVYIYVILVWVVISYISMGGSMDLKAIWQKVRRPWGVLIGIFCQFIIMPAMTFAIARLVAGDDPTIAIGIVLVGTCPGGWLSNIFAVLLDVDFILSVTMTFFSSIIALGMMPLNLLIYATPFTGGNARLSTPFTDLLQQLALLVIPCFLGIAISYKFPKFKDFCGKIIKPISALLIIIGVSLAVPADLYAFCCSPVRVWIVSIVTPILGAFFGLAFARIFARDIRTSITIALETGVQNALLGRTIVGLFYPQPEADLIARVQLIVVLITLIEGSVASVVYSFFRYLVCRRRCDKIMKTDEEDDDKEAVVGVEEVQPKLDYDSNGTTPKTGEDNPNFEMQESG